MEKPDLGQVFTKKNVADFMAALFTLPDTARILDPCFGEGVFLDALKDRGYTRVVGVELDRELYERRMSQKNREKCAQDTENAGEWCICGDFLKFEDAQGFDGIIMNPPYIRQEKIDRLFSFGISKAAIRKEPAFSCLPQTANMYMYFVLKAISLLKDGGEMVLIFPGTWKWASVGRDFLRALEETCVIDSWFNVRGTPFESGALVDVVILKLIRGGKTSMKKVRTVLFEDQKPPVILDLGQAPASGDTVLDAFAKEMLPFSSVASVRRGLTTLNNKMYINPQKLEPKLSSDFVQPIISSPKSISGYSTKGCRTDRLLVTQGRSWEEDRRGKSSAGMEKETAARKEAGQPCRPLEVYTAYLKRWEAKILKDQAPKTLYERIISKDPFWYRLKPVSGRGILFGYIVRQEMRFIASDTDDAVRDNFYVIEPGIDPDVLFVLLNNYYTFYQLEKRGKHYGAGVLKLQKYDIEGLFLVDYHKLDEAGIRLLKADAGRLKESGDAGIIETVTQRLAPYAPVDFDTIKAMYDSARRKRLEVNV